MAYAVTLLFDAALANAVSACWRRLADVKLSRSMLDLQYAPHVTLAVYDKLDVKAATAALDGVLRDAAGMNVTLNEIAVFGPGSGVCYARIAHSPELMQLHAKILETISEPCRPHYRVTDWTPHCTLVTGMSDGDLDRVMRLLRQGWQSVDGRFESVDLVQFVPVVALKRWGLRPTPHSTHTL